MPITSLAGHSLLVRSPRWSVGDEDRHKPSGGCHAIFTTDEKGYSPEIFSRVGGEIYIAGLNSTKLPLPDIVTDKQIDPESIETLKITAKRLLGMQDVNGEPGPDDLEVLREGLCFRPVTEKGVPVIGKIDERKLGMEGVESVWVAAGHGPWGISLSLGTGLCMAEMVEGRKTSADVRKLAP